MGLAAMDQLDQRINHSTHGNADFWMSHKKEKGGFHHLVMDFLSSCAFLAAPTLSHCGGFAFLRPAPLLSLTPRP